MSDVEKWKLVENIVAALEKALNTVPGSKVVANAKVLEKVSKLPRQVDVYVEIPTGNRTLRLGIEVRYKNRPLDLPELEGLIQKLTKLQIDFRCIVSRKGLTADALAEATRNEIECRTIDEIEKPDWWLPTTIPIHTRRLELIHLNINFENDENEAARKIVGDRSLKDIQVSGFSPKPISIGQFAHSAGVLELKKQDQDRIKDQATWRLNIACDNKKEMKLHIGSDVLPVPAEIVCILKIHIIIEEAPISFFKQEGGPTLMTYVSDKTNKQFTLIAIEQPDGTKKLAFSVDDPKPKPTDIEDRKV